ADAVDGRGGDPLVETGLERRLARGCLADPGLEHLAHQHLVDVRIAGQPGPIEGGADGDPAELYRGRGAEPAPELPDRRPSGAHDEHAAVRAASLLHEVSLHPRVR